MPDPNKILHVKKEQFLTAFVEEAGSITASCVKVKINRTTYYEWIANDQEFAKAVEAAKVQAVQRFEDELMRRAFKGNEKPIYQQGKKVGTVREYSDTLGIFLMKGANPDKYRERSTVDSNVNASVTHDGKVGYQAYGDAPAPAAPVAVVETLPPAQRDEDEELEPTIENARQRIGDAAV